MGELFDFLIEISGFPKWIVDTPGHPAVSASSPIEIIINP